MTWPIIKLIWDLMLIYMYIVTKFGADWFIFVDAREETKSNATIFPNSRANNSRSCCTDSNWITVILEQRIKVMNRIYSWLKPYVRSVVFLFPSYWAKIYFKTKFCATLEFTQHDWIMSINSLILYLIDTHFNTSIIDCFWKHCGKRKKCS